MVEKETGVSRHELLRWPIVEFYYELRYEIKEHAAGRKYQEIVNKPKR